MGRRAHHQHLDVQQHQEGGKPLELPPIDRATVTGTTVRYRDPRMQLLADLGIDTIRSTDARIGDAVRFSGNGTAARHPVHRIGRAALAQRRPSRAAGTSWSCVADAAHNHIDVTGTLPSLDRHRKRAAADDARAAATSPNCSTSSASPSPTRAATGCKAQLVKDGDLYTLHASDRAVRRQRSRRQLQRRQRPAAPQAQGEADHARARHRRCSRRSSATIPNAVAAKGKAARDHARSAAHPRILPDAPLQGRCAQEFRRDAAITRSRTCAPRACRSRNIDLTAQPRQQPAQALAADLRDGARPCVVGHHDQCAARAGVHRLRHPPVADADGRAARRLRRRGIGHDRHAQRRGSR